MVVAGDKLNSWKELQKIGSTFTMSRTVKESKEKILNSLWNLEETGSTALGPALLLGITIASSRPASKVILCTDGLANTGIGSLEGKQTDYTPFYTELAEQVRIGTKKNGKKIEKTFKIVQRTILNVFSIFFPFFSDLSLKAKLKGVTVSVMTLVGTDCNVENLSVVTEQSGGEVERVDPLNIGSNLSSILNTRVIAWGTMAMVLLHRGLRFKGEMADEEENRNWMVKDLGNVSADTECSFRYAFR